MRLSKLKGLADTSIRRVYNDDKTVCYGMVGTVEDLFHFGILEWSTAEAWQWAFITPIGNKAIFGDERDALCKEAVRTLYKDMKV